MVALPTVTGACALTAGVLWTAACVVHNSLREGCISDTCSAAGAMRGATPAGAALLVLAGVLAASVCGLLLLSSRGQGRTRAAGVAALLCGLGLVLLLAAGVTFALGASNWVGMPALVVPGLAALVAGLALVAVAVWRARLLPRPLMSLVLATVLLLPLANEQTARVLFAVPFGLAWCAAGAALLHRRFSTPVMAVPHRPLTPAG